MPRLYRLLRALARHPKTSAMGLAGLAGFGVSSYQNPQQLAEPATWIAGLTAIGLLLAADSRDDGDPAPPPIPAATARRRVVPISEEPLKLCA